jgi:hypothetical protein
MREPTALRTPHHRKTRPIPAVTSVARTPTTVETLIWDVIAEMTEAQSEAVTTPAGVGSARGISSCTAETDITLIGNIKNTSLYELNINRPTVTVVYDIVFMAGENLVNSIRGIEHIGGNFFHVGNSTATLPSIAGYFLSTVQIVIIVVDTLILTGSMLNA